MIGLWMISVATASTVTLDRVEGLADDPGTFLFDELPMLAARPGVTGLRFMAQVQPVLRFESGVTVGASLSALTVGWETRPDDKGLGGLVAVPTRLGLPAGLLLAGTWRRGPIWIDVGMRAASGATWVSPSWTDTRIGPTLGLGFVPASARKERHDAGL